MKTSRHLEQVLAHAASRLAATGARRPTEVLPLYKKFLKVEEHRLRLKHQAGGGGREICARRAELVDVLLQYVFGAAETSARGNGAAKVPLALVALGGYGRGELNPFSDIDVMLLHDQEKKGISPHLEEMVQQVLYLLWDSGFKVGHSTRSIKEAVAQANQAIRTKTAMLESRFLAGDAELAQEFRRQFRSKCVNGYEREYVELRIQDQVARHKKFGDSVYMQEPNLKSGCGGLRDYQNLLWITYFKEGSLSTNQLVGKDWLSESDQRRIERAYDFLLRLRTDLHYATGRSTDTLHTNLQEQIAKRLDYSPRYGQLRSETLMRDYYEHTRDIFRVTERITQQFVSGYVTSKTRSLFSFLPLIRADKTPIGDDFFDRSLVRSYQRKKTEERAGLARHVSADELLRNAFRYSKNISRVLVVISHQCLTAELSVPGRIIKPFCDLLLQVRVQRVRGTPRGIMQIGAQAQEKIVRSLDTPLVAFAQPVFADELVGAQRAFFEVGHPQQILIITQSAASAF